jgi:hypothetical protein
MLHNETGSGRSAVIYVHWYATEVSPIPVFPSVSACNGFLPFVPLSQQNLDWVGTRCYVLRFELAFLSVLTTIVSARRSIAGEDRTGELSGSYYMQQLHWTFLDALSYDDHIESRNIEVPSMHALQWYCYYLQYGLGYPAMSCTPPSAAPRS